MCDFLRRGWRRRWNARWGLRKDRLVIYDIINIVQRNFPAIHNITTGHCRLATIFFPAFARLEKVLRRGLIVIGWRTYGVDPKAI